MIAAWGTWNGGESRVESLLVLGPGRVGLGGARRRRDARRLRDRRHRLFHARAAAALAVDACRARAQAHAQGIADPGSTVQGGGGARSLEGGRHRTVRSLKDLPDLPLVGGAGAQGQAGRPPGARGLLHDHTGAAQSELPLLSCRRHRLSQHVRPRLRPHRR